jgi:hypothetical protein
MEEKHLNIDVDRRVSRQIESQVGRQVGILAYIYYVYAHAF